MDHVAIMSHKTPFLARVLSGQKTIESRWYQYKRLPWDKVHVGDTIYFKNSGKPVVAFSKVTRVEQFSLPNPTTIDDLLSLHAVNLGLCTDEVAIFRETLTKKRYVVFIYLDEVKLVLPFKIDKSAFSPLAAWITLPDIGLIRRA